MFELFRKAPKAPRSETGEDTPDLAKRKFIMGAAASAGVIAGGSKLFLDYKDDEVEKQKAAEALLQEKESLAGLELTESVPAEASGGQYFNATVEPYKAEFVRDLEYIKTHGGATETTDTEQRTMLEYIHDNLICDGLSPEGLEALQRAVVGLTIQESRCDNTRVSEDKAAGVLMIMPNVWAEHATEGMDIKSTADSVVVASKLFSQIKLYFDNNVATELNQIRDQQFGGDQVAFETQFLIYALMSGYHAGMGRVGQVIKHFTGEFKKPEDTVAVLENTEKMTNEDVFHLMVHTAYSSELISKFGEDSLEYVYKATAAIRVLEESFDDDTLFALLGYRPYRHG